MISFLFWGPEQDTPVSLGDHLLGVLRHGNLGHLVVNLGFLVIGAFLTERRLGVVLTMTLAIVLSLVGTLAEFTFGGPGFVGTSAAAYGLVSFGLLATTPPEERLTTVGLLALALAAEATFLPSVAIHAHVSPSLLGGGLAMLSLFGSKGPKLVPMKWEHVSRAVEIIDQTDEDDAAEAEQTFLGNDFENMFVLMNKGRVIGLTGYSFDDATPDLAWLSWTYLDEAEQGQGHGSYMINEVLGQLAKFGIRKIFIESSDYAEDGVKIYAAAHKLYEDFGANLELTVPDYHSPGEAKLIFGIDNPDAPKTAAPELGAEEGLRFDGFETAAETDDVAALFWSATPVGIAGLDEYCLDASRKHRMAVFAAPDDLTTPNEAALRAAQFEQLGKLKDYYGTDMHQVWWARRL